MTGTKMEIAAGRGRTDADRALLVLSGEIGNITGWWTRNWKKETDGMEMSASVVELAKSLAKAQGEMKHAKKNATNPHFRSSYANLESTLDACKEPLAKYGLSVVQMPFDNDGRIGVETILLHESGEWIKGNLAVKMTQETNPQNAGSILSYLRRYSLQAAVGIATEDDDANAATGKPTSVDTAPAVTLDPAVLATLTEAKTVEELQAAWNKIPVGSRHGYTATKDAAKARIAKGAVN